MVFELVGSRVLGPYLGTSIFVWTSIIGIILGSLSIGYWLGGKIADKKPQIGVLSSIIFFSAIFIGLTILINSFVLIFLQEKEVGLKLSTVISSIVLFAPASIMLGMVSPFAVKLKMDSLKTSGSTVGNLYAISTIGSITGTFLAGFYLIPLIGTTNLLILLSVVLIGVSVIASPRQILRVRYGALLLIVSFFLVTSLMNTAYAKDNFIDIDTEYNRIWIYDFFDDLTGKAAKNMQINTESHSAIFLDDDDLIFEYTKYYRLVKHFMPDPQAVERTLMIGGGAYSYPKDFLEKFPNAVIDVVEIDPQVTELAKEYFRLEENPRLSIHHTDGRVFLNQTENKYDAIFGDAFSSYFSIPYQLTTKEVVQRKYDILNEDGVVILNIISSIDGEKGEFLRAEYHTYKSIFPQVYLFPVQNPGDGEMHQNVILVALKSVEVPSFENDDGELNNYLRHLWAGEVANDMPILTDDFAPVDYYISKII